MLWTRPECDDRLVEPVGSADASSWSRASEPLRLEERSVAKDDPDPEILSCHRLFLPELET